MKKFFDFRTLAEIAFVLAVMLGVKWLADSIELIGAGQMGMWAGIIAATLFMKLRGATWRGLGLKLPKGPRDLGLTLGLALLAVVSVIGFLAFVNPLIGTYFGLEAAPDATARFEFFLGKPLYFISYLVGVVWIGAAIGEELLFRGFLLNRLGDLFGGSKASLVVALVVHAVIFGALHAYQGLPGMIGTGVAALIFGSIYLGSKRRLVPVILGHGIINSIGLTAYYLSDGAIT